MVDPEKVPDVDEGQTSDLEIGGMTAEEQATWDAMKAGRDIPEAGGENDAAQDNDASPDAGGGDGADSDAGDSTVDNAERVAEGDGEKRVPPKTISYGKYQREQKKKDDALAALQARLDGAVKETATEREQRLRLDERTKMLLDAISAKLTVEAKADEPADPEPDGEDDPIAHAAWTSRELKRTQKIIQDIQTGTKQRDTATAAENEERQVYDTYENDLKREATADPSFAEAFVHLRESRYTELGFIYAGIDINDKAAVDAALTPEQQGKLAQDIQRSFHNEQMLVAREALSKGKSPAKVVANLARARGWKAPAAGAVAKPANGAASAKPANGAAKPTVGEELAAIREGQAASRSLSDGGSSSGNDITPERLAAMTEEEFQDFYDSMPKAKLDRMMGKTLQ